MPVSVSILTNPQTLAPANAELWLRTDSASSGLTDFKYVFTPLYKLEPFATTSYTTIGSYRVPPRPDGGNGLFTPNRLLKSSFVYNVNPYISRFNPVSQSLIAYQIRYGAEYDPSLDFTDTINVSGNLGFTFSVAHDLSVNDIITINKDNKNYNPGYDGTCSVTAIVNTYSIKTNKTFNTSTLLANEAGSVDLVSKISGTSSTFYTWPGTKQYEELGTNFLDYMMSLNTSAKFLTNQPDYVKVGENDYQTISLILPYNNLTFWYMGIDCYDASGNLMFGTTSRVGLSASNTYMRQDFGIGPKNLSNIGITMSSVDTYRCFMFQLPDEPPFNMIRGSQYKYFKVDRTCSSYTNTRLCFMNRRGGFDYFNFTLDNKKQVDIKRTEYQRELAWNYQLGDRGQSILSQDATVKHTANSNWITENESIWLEELLTSPEVYVLGNTSSISAAANGYKLPIILTDNSYEVKTYLRNQVFNLQINYRMANDLNLQNE